MKLVELAGGVGTAIAQGGLSAPAAIGTAVQVLTLLAAGGAGLDTIRKSKIIGRLKDGDSTQPPGA